MERIIEEFRMFQKQFEKRNETLSYEWIKSKNEMILSISYIPTDNEKIDIKIFSGQVKINGFGKIKNRELTFATNIFIPPGLDHEKAVVKFLRKGLIQIHFPQNGTVPEEFTPVKPGQDDISI